MNRKASPSQGRIRSRRPRHGAGGARAVRGPGQSPPRVRDESMARVADTSQAPYRRRPAPNTRLRPTLTLERVAEGGGLRSPRALRTFVASSASGANAVSVSVEDSRARRSRLPPSPTRLCLSSSTVRSTARLEDECEAVGQAARQCSNSVAAFSENARLEEMSFALSEPRASRKGTT